MARMHCIITTLQNSASCGFGRRQPGLARFGWVALRFVALRQVAVHSQAALVLRQQHSPPATPRAHPPPPPTSQPWQTDFFNRFPQVPQFSDWRSVEKGVFTNVLYYRANYLALLMGLFVIGMCVLTTGVRRISLAKLPVALPQVLELAAPDRTCHRCGRQPCHHESASSSPPTACAALRSAREVPNTSHGSRGRF